MSEEKSIEIIQCATGMHSSGTKFYELVAIRVGGAHYMIRRYGKTGVKQAGGASMIEPYNSHQYKQLLRSKSSGGYDFKYGCLLFGKAKESGRCGIEELIDTYQATSQAKEIFRIILNDESPLGEKGKHEDPDQTVSQPKPEKNLPAGWGAW